MGCETEEIRWPWWRKPNSESLESRFMRELESMIGKTFEVSDFVERLKRIMADEACDSMENIRHKSLKADIKSYIKDEKSVWEEIETWDLIMYIKKTDDTDDTDYYEIVAAVMIAYIADRMTAGEKQYIKLKRIIGVMADVE